ncbi:forkhead box protein N1 [Ahaetulla prasina]|uniref:forkhead box protein N1 n=1 Tax=Ahaetulla prasina TaxID=499056 RepID=UPI0026483E22|nr:forkhead box protein N1 [Ahaetulla prasina]XP_058020232.1 forkhead box protein N1 [Ahaetulla prasina]
MVSLLQDQARIKFPSLDPLESSPCGDRMQACEESGSPARQEHPAFHCQPPDGQGRPDRNPPGSPPSCGASPPCPEQLFARFPAGQQPLPREMAAYKVPSSGEKFRRSAYEEGAPRGRFPKSALRTPFHPYQRQVPEEPFPAAAQEGFEETAGLPGTYPPPLPHLGPDPAWSNGMQYGRLGQEPHIQRALEADARLKEQPSPFCCQPHGPPEYCASHPFHQYHVSGARPLPFLSAPHHPYQRMGPPGHQQQPPPLFPKPIYSYSILIFMALKNSKTGSLPVSEIYNFMTEHFPYFKTAPDGWKNSVRHNLSLNKCFEKVENKTGSSSRKGCLWALNPAKIDKMQEELQKWRRKDPVAIRKSMAKPEELEVLIGDKAEKLLSCSPAGAAGPSVSGQMPLQPLPLYAQNGQGALPSPLPAQSPPACGMKMLVPSRPELLLLDGDLSMDVDALNPSITGFDLQGNLWEALKDDSLAVEPLGLISASPTAAQPDFLAPCLADANHSSGDKLPQHQNFPDVQLTTLYSAFLELDTGLPPPYLNPPGSKPVALV